MGHYSKDPTPEDVLKFPALKLIEFYETLGNGVESMVFATSHAIDVCGVDIPSIEK
jgi:hypothetical protein